MYTPAQTRTNHIHSGLHSRLAASISFCCVLNEWASVNARLSVCLSFCLHPGLAGCLSDGGYLLVVWYLGIVCSSSFVFLSPQKSKIVNSSPWVPCPWCRHNLWARAATSSGTTLLVADIMRSSGSRFVLRSGSFSEPVPISLVETAAGTE